MKRTSATILAIGLGLILAAAALAGELTKKDLVKETQNRITQINILQAKQLFDAGDGHFVDCREPDEYSKGHIPGAVNIPRGLLEFKIEETFPDRNTRIILYCKSGGRGCLATDAVNHMGYANAVNIDGGWKAWMAASYPIAVESREMSKKELVQETMARIRQIKVAQAKDMLDKGGALFVDCREPDEFMQGHIPGATNIPRGLLEFKIEQAFPDRKANMILYCKSGGRGCLSVEAINRMGYSNAVNMEGGWQAWAAAKYPTAVEAGALTKKDLVRETATQVLQIDIKKAKELFDRGWTYFVDCREPKEFKTGHIPGALNIPRGFLEFKIEDMVPDKKADVVIYCKTGGRACLSIDTIKRMGYENAVNLDGGWKAWMNAGYPVE